MPFTIISILFSLLYAFFDKTKYKVFAMGSGALMFFFGVSIDLMDHPEIQVFFRYKKPTLTEITYSFFFITLIALLICHILIYFFYNRNVYDIPQKQYSDRKLKRAFYILSFLSLTGLAVNLINVVRSGFTVELLVIDPRQYEELFGFNVLLNYLYFLNIPAVLVYIYIIKVHETKVRFGKFLVLILIIISGFHGIKYTIFDSILIPGFFYLMISRNTQLKYIALVFGLLIGIYSIFSTFVRGGYYESGLLNFVSYIIPNYLNLFHNIESYQSQFTPFYNLFIPDKIQELFPVELKINPGVSSTYSINASYNMYTSLDVLYSDLNLLGPFFYMLIFSVAIYLYNHKYRNIIYVYILSDIVYNFNMSFYTYSYIKIKYFYYIGIFVIVHLLTQKNKKPEVQNESLETKF